MAGRHAKTSKRRDGLVTIIFLTVSALAGTWFMSDGLRDAQDVTWVRSDVVEAKPQRGDNHSSVPWYLAVYTEDCGTIVYQIGTNEENVEGLAATFEPGPYEFKLGAVSQRRAEGKTLLDHAALAKDIRRLPAEDNALEEGPQR